MINEKEVKILEKYQFWKSIIHQKEEEDVNKIETWSSYPGCNGCQSGPCCGTGGCGGCQGCSICSA